MLRVSIVSQPNYFPYAHCHRPQSQYSYPVVLKWIFKYVPGVMRAYRNFIMAKSDLAYPMFQKQHVMGSIVKKVGPSLTHFNEVD